VELTAFPMPVGGGREVREREIRKRGKGREGRENEAREFSIVCKEIVASDDHSYIH